MDNDKTPFELGYSMPAEWERHEGTWIAWPKNRDSFPEEIIGSVEKTYLEMISALHKSEKVNLLVDDKRMEERVKALLERNKAQSNVVIHRINTADVWFRDYGPIFIAKKGSGEVAFVHWKFNAWGAKYDDLVEDTHVPEKLPLERFKRFDAQMVLEGGSIDTNGEGTLLTTEQCLLNTNRNPDFTKEDIEKNLRDYLGATNIIWLRGGIVGDDTDGHVDDIARFVNKDTVVCCIENNKKDENYLPLEVNMKLLERAKDQDGKRLKVVTLPMPNPVVYRNQRLPASYANFYMANNVVLVPVFNDENDAEALRILQGLFHRRKVIGINCRELVYGFGSLHCVTQQQPKNLQAALKNSKE